VTWELVTLLVTGALDCRACIERFGISERVFQRDLRDLRVIGTQHGFAVDRTKGGRALLAARNRRVWELSAGHRNVLATPGPFDATRSHARTASTPLAFTRWRPVTRPPCHSSGINVYAFRNGVEAYGFDGDRGHGC
jgi:ribosomal protein L34